MTYNKRLFTSESVTEGHPDKIADQVSDAILDEILKDDPNARVACETTVTTGMALISGEISTTTYVDIPKVVRETIKDIGYTRAKYGYDSQTMAVLTAIDEQSPDIAQGVDIGVKKRIPSGGGFGGGSSDAATVLVALNRLWGLDWPTDSIARLGLSLGADVPVFVHGQNAWAEGVGDVITPIDLPPAWYVLAFPGVHAPTAGLFQAEDLTRDSAPATIANFLSGSLSGNAFEPVLRKRENAVDSVLNALSAIGTPRLTGSGSGCFVEFATRDDAEAALARLPAQLDARVAEGVAKSPLLDALEGRH